jgi:hypothetical protein
MVTLTSQDPAAGHGRRRIAALRLAAASMSIRVSAIDTARKATMDTVHSSPSSPGNS